MACLPTPCDGCTYGTGSVWCCPETTTTDDGTTGTGGWLLEGDGHPDDVIGTPTDATHVWWYWDYTNFTQYHWSVVNQAWQ